MSMPSDTNADITEAMDEDRPPQPSARRTDGLTREQIGWIGVAVVAFLGVAIVGPAATRAQARARDAATRARDAAARARKRGSKAAYRLRRKARRLGGGTIWR